MILFRNLSPSVHGILWAHLAMLSDVLALSSMPLCAHRAHTMAPNKSNSTLTVCGFVKGSVCAYDTGYSKDVSCAPICGDRGGTLADLVDEGEDDGPAPPCGPAAPRGGVSADIYFAGKQPRGASKAK